jgi:hypothetical protein
MAVDNRLVPLRLLRRTGGTPGAMRNPQGPDTTYVPEEPAERKKVQRGGLFLCTDQYCSRYYLGTRGKRGSTGTNPLGFRCVMLCQQTETQGKKSRRASTHVKQPTVRSD